jgi:hypothetical protein
VASEASEAVAAAAVEEVAEEEKRAKVEAEKASSVAPGPHQEKISALESNTSRLSNAEIDELVKDGLLTKKQGKAAKRFRNSRGTKVAEVIKQNQATQQGTEEAVAAAEAIEEAEEAVAAAAEAAEEAEEAAVEAEASEAVVAAEEVAEKAIEAAEEAVAAAAAEEVAEEAKRAKVEAEKASSVAPGPHQEKITALESNTSRLSNAEIDELVEDGLLTKKQSKAAKRFRNSRGTKVAEVIKQNQATQQAAEPGIFLRTLRSVISTPRKVVSALATRMGVTKTPATAEEVAEGAKRAKVEAEEELAAAKALLDKLRDKAKAKVEAEKIREVTDEAKRAKEEPKKAREVAEGAKRAKVEAEEELAAAKALLDKLRDNARAKVEAAEVSEAIAAAAAEEVAEETKRAKVEVKKARAVATGSPQEKITALESNTSRLSNAEINKLVEGGLLTKKQGKAAKRFFNSRGTEVAEVIRENQRLIEDLMDDLNKIVSQRRTAKVKLKDGSTMKVDATTAVMLLYVHGALNQNNRVKMAQILTQDKAGFTKMVNFSTKQGKMSSDDHKLSNISNNKLCPPYPECIEDFIGEQDTSGCE